MRYDWHFWMFNWFVFSKFCMNYVYAFSCYLSFCMFVLFKYIIIYARYLLNKQNYHNDDNLTTIFTLECLKAFASSYAQPGWINDCLWLESSMISDSSYYIKISICGSWSSLLLALYVFIYLLLKFSVSYFYIWEMWHLGKLWF